MQNLISVDNAQYSKIVKAIGSSFTPSAVLDFEHAIDQSVVQLVFALSRTSQQPVDITKWLQLFAMDVLNRIAFGESPGYLERGSDVNAFIEASEGRNDYWYSHSAIPDIDYIINKGPLARLMRRTPVSLLGGMAMRKFKERKAPQNSEITNDLLQRYMQAQSRYPNDIADSHVVGLVATSIAAGADTAATTLAGTLLLVLQNPGVKAKLEDEFANLEKRSERPSWSEVGSLPYLDATIKESMRYFPATAFSMDRVVPVGGMTIGGTPYPASRLYSITTTPSIEIPKSLDKTLMSSDQRDGLRLMRSSYA